MGKCKLVLLAWLVLSVSSCLATPEAAIKPQHPPEDVKKPEQALRQQESLLPYILINTAPEQQPCPEDPFLNVICRYSPDSFTIINRVHSFPAEVTIGTSKISAPKIDYREFISSTSYVRQLGELGTAVHELNHNYTGMYAVHYAESLAESERFEYLAFYIDAEHTLLIRLAELFPACLISTLVPEELRTSRFKDYILSGSQSSTQKEGLFGLLDELHAYYRDMGFQYEMFDYYRTLEKDADTWLWYAWTLTSSYSACAEFSYWILTYLIYAKAQQPAAYAQIMQNPALVWAIVRFQTAFDELINLTNSRLEEVAIILREVTGEKTWVLDLARDSFRVKGIAGGYQLNTGDYFKLANAMQADSQYAAMRNLLTEAARGFSW